MPEAWRALLAARSPLYRRLPAALRARLEPQVRQFLHRVPIIGCAGQPITDEVRVVIAALAVLLVQRAGVDAYARLYGVLVYPDEFVVSDTLEDELTGVVTEGEQTVSGQAHDTDRVLISWRDVIDGDATDGPYNVVLHEFAHYLDHASGGALSDGGGAWQTAYQALCEAVDRGEPTLIDPYGAEDRAEFFAVATETFFEAAVAMQRQHPQLYAALRDCYALDPASWPEGGVAS